MKTLSYLFVFLGCGALLLLAEDFWKKPFTEWSEKDANKLLQNSPWAHEVSISMGNGGMGGGGGRGGRRGGGGMGGDSEGSGAPGGMDSGGPASPGGAGRGGRGGGSDMEGGGANTQSIMLCVRWQSALPVREALVVSKLGREKAESDDAKKFLGQTIPNYVVAIIGVPAGMARMPQERLQAFAKNTTLVIKDKEPIAAINAQVQGSQKPNSADVYFIFPKTNEIALEDKEVEFVSKVGPFEIKRKFKLKDMLVGDKLEL